MKARLGEWMRKLFGYPVAKTPQPDIADRQAKHDDLVKEIRERLARARAQIDQATDLDNQSPPPRPHRPGQPS